MNRQEKLFLIIVSVLALFFCVFRLKETYILAEDIARDTYRMLNIWQNKEYTAVGPPASFSLTSEFKFYFGSFSYYLGLLGLWLFSFDPIGAAVPTILLFIASIPFFYKFLRNIKTSFYVSVLGTFLYSFSPLVLNQIRFFWNPNTVIPLSVFFWFLATLPNKRRVFETFFIAGIIMAIIFNFHYFTVVPMLTWAVIILAQKEWNKMWGIFSGFFIGSLPLMIYELTDDFRLTHALKVNFESQTPTTSGLTELIGRLGEIFMAVTGFKHSEIFFTDVINKSRFWFWTLSLIITLLAFMTIKQKIKEKRMILLIPLFVTIVFATLFSNSVFYARYVFGAMPLVIWFTAEMLEGKIQRWLLIPVALSLIYTSISILTFQNGLATGYIPIKTLVAMSETIISEDFKGKYNLSENTDGDAYATALRYYVQRDAVNKPRKMEMYGWLDRLYVVAPSIERIKNDNLYEFYASGPWQEPFVTDFGEVKLYRFDK